MAKDASGLGRCGPLLLTVFLLFGGMACSRSQDESNIRSTEPGGGATPFVDFVGIGSRALVHDGVTYPDQRLVVPVNHLPNPYHTIWPWGELPTGPMDAGDFDGRSSFIGVAEGPDGHLYALSRCIENSCVGSDLPPLMKFDQEGNLLASWGEGMMYWPHGMAIDRQGNVWVADEGNHLVFKFSPDGDLLMTLGERDMRGDPPHRLTQPTHVAVTPEGYIFVTEGHDKSPDAPVSRVSKFAPDGAFLLSWGRTGSGIGEFHDPHTIALDSQGRVFVGDRHNNRIQIFDQNGNFIDLWYQFGRPSGIFITSDDRIYVADSESYDYHNPGWEKGIRIGSARDGSVDYFIKDLESTVTHSGPEGVGVDLEGNVYGGVVRRRMLERHVLGAEPPAVSAEPVWPLGAAMTHLGHVARGFPGTPEGRGLAATASIEANVAALHANFAAGDPNDLDAMKTHVRHTLHAVDPEEWSEGPGLGFGLKRAVEATVTHIEMALEGEGASEALRAHGPRIATEGRQVAARADRMIDLAHQVLASATAAGAAPLVEELRDLAIQQINRDIPSGSLAHMEDEVYNVLIGDRILRILQ